MNTRQLKKRLGRKPPPGRKKLNIQQGAGEQRGRARARAYLEAVAEHDPVPCGGCTACCRSRNGVELREDHGDDIAAFDRLGARIGLEHGVARGFIGGRLTLIVAQKGNGDCAFVTDEGGCAIYEDRPSACRAFDCRRSAGLITGADRIAAIMGHVFPLSVFQAADAIQYTLKPLPEEEELLANQAGMLVALAMKR